MRSNFLDRSEFDTSFWAESKQADRENVSRNDFIISFNVLIFKMMQE